MDNVTLGMLRQSNWIEREYTDRALKDAVKAWEWLLAHRNEELKLKHILRVHELLARNISPEIAGKLRDCDVWIGGNRKMFVSDYLLRSQLDKVCGEYQKIISSCKQKESVELEKEIRQNHVKFEEIHPFCDFNGRTFRIIMNVLRLKCGLPILVIHGMAEGEAEIHWEQRDYYLWFRGEN